MAIGRPRCSAVLEDARSEGIVDGAGSTDEAAQLRSREAQADVPLAPGSARCKCPLVGRVAAKPTVGLDLQEALCSCPVSPQGWCANGCSALQDLNDDHRGTAVPADEDRRDSSPGIVGLGAGLRHNTQQATRLREPGAAHRVGEQPVVTDAMEAAGQHVQQGMK